MIINTDFCIVGGGMVGLSIANQLLENGIAKNIVIIDKEIKLGLHSSGLNSGVLHAGIYYEPNSLKAKVCVPGSKRLKEWVKERNLPIKECGKVIVPQSYNLDNQIDLLYKRGKANGVIVEIWDETDLKNYIPSWQSILGYTHQNTMILDDTIENNIAIGDEIIEEDRLEKVIKIANLQEFIIDLEEGTKTRISESGNNISGGQKQRIGIARTLYKNPDILIFDEVFNSLDKNTTEKILFNLNSFYKEKTMLFISHDLSLKKYCDQIIDLNNF